MCQPLVGETTRVPTPHSYPFPKGNVFFDFLGRFLRLGVGPGSVGIFFTIDVDGVVTCNALSATGRLVSAGLKIL